MNAKIQVQKTVIVPFECAQMFPIVEDITRYPEFLSWCEAGEILQRQPVVPPTEQGLALPTKSDYRRIGRVHIRQFALKSRFTTLNFCQPPHRITVANAPAELMADDPFAYINGEWNFVSLGDMGCKVSVEMQYSFRSALLQKLLGRLFAGIIEGFAGSFVQRAQALYHD